MGRVFALVIADDVHLVLARLIHEVGRLVHVIPNSGHTTIGVCLMEVSPPVPCLGQAKINEDTVARPNLTNEELAVFTFLKISLFQTLVENVVGLVLGK